MNHLAHAMLAEGAGTEFALGSALGDFVHGRPDPTWSAGRRAGLIFHRGIDRFTDQHPAVMAARREFQPPMRRYAGIILDVWFDHLLVNYWGQLAGREPLVRFSQRWLALLDDHSAELPVALRRFTDWMHARGLPAAYGDDDTLTLVFEGLARRLSRPSPVARALPVLKDRRVVLERQFEAFFPDLVLHARALRGTFLASTSANSVACAQGRAYPM